MTIAPPADSINLNNDNARDDFPAPVLPTIPNYGIKVKTIVTFYDHNISKD